MSSVSSRNPAKTASPETGTEGWWRHPFSVFQSNLQEVDATMDVERALDIIEAQGADTWLINTAGIVSFYPTELPFQTRSPFLVDRASGDMIGDAIAAAHRRNVRVICRCDFSKVSSRIAAEHPDWLYLSPKGERQVYNTLYSCCPAGDYYQERSIEVVDEILARYPADGFFFNWFIFPEFDYSRVYHGPCHCAKCQASFAEFSGGKSLPSGPDDETYAEWRRFGHKVIRDLCIRIGAHIRKKRPEAALVLNREGADVIYHEANNAFGRDLWPHITSESVGAHATAFPEVPVMVNSVTFVDMPYRMAGEQPESFAQYLLQAIARGGNPSTYIMGAPGRIPYASLPVAGEIQRFFRDHHDVYEGLGPASTVALVRPNLVRSAVMGHMASASEFQGLFSGLKECGLPFDVLSKDHIARIGSEGGLGRFSLIILPDVGEIGRDAAEALDAFVRAGGHVVLTGGSAITAEGESELATGPAVMQSGAPLEGDALWSSYVTDVDQPDAGDYRLAARVVPVYGSYADYVWKPRAERIGRYIPQAPYGPPEKCYGHMPGDRPAAMRLVSGGSVTQFPWTVGHTYREFGTTEVRDFLQDTIAGFAKPEIISDLPEQVEIIAGRSAAGLVIHVVNQTGVKTRAFGPHVTLGPSRIRIRGGRGPAQLLRAGESVAGHNEGDELVIDLPKLELFEVIVLAGEPEGATS
ncbi:alpha-amylase family protein [uncultured Martelella sp.]|uniref:alpha-amylase family protein n=1 Tax=uncultured Martelella sp. TaxID=392331 RepID=UPI0029C997BD|nr:alpha-amylase family protein [uncultured Martelella sp.]